MPNGIRPTWKKNYDVASDSYHTSCSSIDVDCEACHGPGSLHAEAPARHRLILSSETRAWVLADGENTARLQTGNKDSEQVEICAACRARRGQPSDAHSPGEPLYDGYRPALLEQGLYHADGQILDEVYVYGSFLQSRMYAAGVICSDCHEPHSTGLRARGNALCTRCRVPAVFDDASHHHHQADSTGAQCVNCHMPDKTYMVIDSRRDHSMRVPRPDLTVTLDVPNVCQDCHDDRGAAWAAESVAWWYPQGRQDAFHYGQALHAGSGGSRERAELLARHIEDPEQPAIGLLANQFDEAALGVLERQLESPDVEVQLAAVEALSGLPVQWRIELGQRFLTHERSALRMAAARVLLAVRDELDKTHRAGLDAALAEYMESQQFNADRAQGQFNGGNVFAEQGRLDAAEHSYRSALEREPAFAAAYVNLADLYRQTGREDQALVLLQDGIRRVPDGASLRIALGHSLVHSGRADAALPQFERTVSIDPDNPYYHYVLGVALHSSGAPKRAVRVLETANARFPGYREILVALATMLRDAGETARAVEYARRLQELSPADTAGIR